MMMPVASDLMYSDVFEGPEKKLEVFFSVPVFSEKGAPPEGFRVFSESVWTDLLIEAACSILHRKSSTHFDAYLLSESSLFVYSDKVILKTCGTTKLLLTLPKLLALAKSLDASVKHVHYGHYRYKFPDQQLFPHASFDQERAYLTQYFGTVHSSVLGPTDGRCWYALCTREDMLTSWSSPVSTNVGDDIFEIVMEGLSKDVCKQFFFSTFPNLSGKELAGHMTSVSRIGALLPDVDIDDWAFEPCGYSMNGLRGQFYYTIHITPEDGFSYASFETNDPQYRHPRFVQAVVDTFAPSVLTVTLTTRTKNCELPTYSLVDFEVNCSTVASLGAGVSVSCTNYNIMRASDASDASDEEHLPIGKSDGLVAPTKRVELPMSVPTGAGKLSP